MAVTAAHRDRALRVVERGSRCSLGVWTRLSVGSGRRNDSVADRRFEQVSTDLATLVETESLFNDGTGIVFALWLFAGSRPQSAHWADGLSSLRAAASRSDSSSGRESRMSFVGSTIR